MKRALEILAVCSLSSAVHAAVVSEVKEFSIPLALNAAMTSYSGSTTIRMDPFSRAGTLTSVKVTMTQNVFGQIIVENADLVPAVFSTSLMHFDGGFSTVNNLKNDWEVFEGPQVDFNKALAANDFTPGGGPDWHDFGSVGGDDRTLTASPGAEFNRALWTASDTVPFIDISIHYLGALANATEGVPFQGFDTQLKSFGTAGRIRIEYTYNPIPSPGSGLAFVPFLRRRRR